MRRRHYIAVTILGCGFYLASYCARADMIVLASNVSSYPTGKRVKGDKIGKLLPGEKVQVLDLSDNKTRIFEGDPLFSGRTFGTRKIKQK